MVSRTPQPQAVEKYPRPSASLRRQSSVRQAHCADIMFSSRLRSRSATAVTRTTAASATTTLVAKYCPPATSISARASIKLLLDGFIVLFICVLVASFASADSQGTRMVRLCIASVDPLKLSSQCVMCIRREFPLTVIDCTGITKVNDLISSPLSVQEATCLIYNCRRQVPDVKPEPYHGSTSHAAGASFTQASRNVNSNIIPPIATLMQHPGLYGGYMNSPSVQRYPNFYNPAGFANAHIQQISPYGSPSPISGAFGLVGARTNAFPYAMMPNPYASPLSRYRSPFLPMFR